MAEVLLSGKRIVKVHGGVYSKNNITSYNDEESYDDDSDEEYELVTDADGRKVSREILQKYLRQVEESEGFDITLDLELGVPFGAPIIPQRGKEKDPEYLELSSLAIATFNSENVKCYKFEKNVNVNISFAAGMWCYITFQARDADPASDNFNALKTFQTLAWWGIDGSREVKFCRLKNGSGDEVDQRSPDSNVEASATP